MNDTEVMMKILNRNKVKLTYSKTMISDSTLKPSKKEPRKSSFGIEQDYDSLVLRSDTDEISSINKNIDDNPYANIETSQEKTSNSNHKKQLKINPIKVKRSKIALTRNKLTFVSSDKQSKYTKNSK